MPLTEMDVLETMAALDPFRWQWNDQTPEPVPGTARLRRRLLRLRKTASAVQSRGIAAVADVFGQTDLSRRFDVIRGLPSLAGRHPLVVAHGPSLAELLPSIKVNRRRLYIVAPFRTALRLAEAGIAPDAIVLADAHMYVNAISVRAWQSASTEVQQLLSSRAALVIDACAPPQIYNDFRRVHLFDDGLQWLSKDAVLPFWGSSTLPAVCLPIALGARCVALGGIDLGAQSGKLARSWNGQPMRLDPAMATTHGLLEAVAEALPGRFVDVARPSIMKRGFRFEPLEDFIQRDAPNGCETKVSQVCTLADLVKTMLNAAEGLAPTVVEMSATAERLCALAALPESGCELDALLSTIEHEWRVLPSHRAALSFIQPPYLQAMWQLAEAGVTPRNPELAVRMKAKLVGPEVADLDAAFQRSVEICRLALSRA